MIESTPSIIEEDENNDHYHRIHHVDDRRTDTSLLKGQNDQLPSITSTST